MRKEKVFIIAEAGVNHNGNLDLAFQMIDMALKAKVDAIKFQAYVSENLVTSKLSMSDYQKNNMKKNISQLEMLKKYELRKEDFEKLIEYSDKKNIMLLATPFDRRSVDMLVELKRPYLKIDSGSITNHPFLEYVAKTRIPLIVSTGGSTMEEVREAVNVIEKHNQDLTLLHCTVMYPAPYDKVNLCAMVEMMNKFNYPVGYSDHTIGIEVSIAAVAMGARVIEKHFTLDRSLEGPDHKISLEPEELVNMVRSIRNIEKALGKTKKEPCRGEKRVLEKGRRSIIAARNLKKGQKITKNDVFIKRPGTGIHPKHLKDILGKTVSSDIQKDKPLQFSNIKF